MSESLRIFLYPLFGTLATLAFSSRFFIQWYLSEKRSQSTVTPIFWKVSLLGNIFMCLHSLIQVQFHFCIIQAFNFVIAWRNLNLMHKKSKHLSKRSLLLLFLISLFLVTLLFMTQTYLSYGYVKWIRTPTLPGGYHQAEKLPIAWHFLGTLGASCFAGRFWIQLWESEKKQHSILSHNFWILSLFGSLITFIYALRMSDIVNILGYGMGVIPYIRNLMLIRREHKKTSLARK